MEGRFVSYLRVSTKRQGRSGLGEEAQRKAINDYLNGGHWELVKEFVEIESGKRHENRPKLQAALEHCKMTNSTLLIAKIDRLARNMAFISNLMESGVEFTAADFPTANKLTVHILAAIAEHEREMISKRVKEALAVVRTRGVKKLGNPHTLDGLPEGAAERGNAASIKSRVKKANEHAQRLYGIIKQYQDSGLSLRAIAKKLNHDRAVTPTGKGEWKAATVKRILDRANVNNG
ncbi:MAG: recombinase family protein [Syntrophorhabdaceae bacterium]|nr:recombinase family protein [Syntrophorhabdaceae bacterium]